MSLKVSWVKQNENFAHSTYSSEKTKAQNEKVVMANQTNVPAPNSLLHLKFARNLHCQHIYSKSFNGSG